MSKVLIERESLENIARKIRQKTASTEKMTVADMPGRIGKLHSYSSASAINNTVTRVKIVSGFSSENLSFVATAVKTD